MKTDALIRALRENPALFSSLNAWLEEREQSAVKRCSTADDLPDIYRAQGATREIRSAMVALEKLAAARRT